MYEEQLKELGLTENEVKIYLLLLKLGMMNPSHISEKLGLHRGYVYDALERMLEKGVVSFVLKNNKKHFQATNPSNLVELLRLKLENLQKIVPNLIALANVQKENTVVELHKGRRVYRTLLKDIISTVKENQEILLIGVDENVLITDVEPIYLKQYFNIIKENNIKEKAIIKTGKKRYNIPNVSYKELDPKYLGNIEQLTYGNKVAIFIIGDPYYLIIIEDRKVAETYRKQFSLLWSVAKA